VQERDLSSLIVFIITAGLPATLLLTAAGLAMGFIIGVTLALIRVYAEEDIAILAQGYENIFRGIPVLVLMLLFLVMTGWPAMFSAALALGLRSGAYQSQIVRGAILSVNENQMLAAYALGMNRTQTARHIVLPQAFRLALPGWSNEYAVVTKDTAWAGAIGVLDMVKASDYLVFESPVTFLPAILAITMIYFFLTYPVTRYAGERMSKKLRSLGLGVSK
jgi:polar amino acid transport system permease protein